MMMRLDHNTCVMQPDLTFGWIMPIGTARSILYRIS